MTPRRFLFVLLVLLPLIACFLLTEKAISPGWYHHPGPKATRLTPIADLPPAYGRAILFDGDPKEEHGLAFEEVVFTKPDGLKLRGWYIPADEPQKEMGQEAKDEEERQEEQERDRTAASPTRGIIGVHGAGMDRREMSRYLPAWHTAGYNVLVFDCQEHGLSDGDSRGISYGIREHDDVVSAVDFVKESYGWERIGLFGSSQGGASVIVAAAKKKAVTAVVSENPFSDIRKLLRAAFDSLRNGRKVGASNEGFIISLIKVSGKLIPEFVTDFVIEAAIWRIGGWGRDDEIDPLDFIDKVSQPILLMHGTDDNVTPYEHSLELAALAKHKDSRLWTVQGGVHGKLWNENQEAHDREVLAFFAQHLE